VLKKRVEEVRPIEYIKINNILYEIIKKKILLMFYHNKFINLLTNSLFFKLFNFGLFHL
jgi:hypothetical protein